MSAVELPRAHAGVSASMMKKRTSHKKHQSNVAPSKPISQPRRNIVGCRIQHGWKEGSGSITQWKGTVLDQVPVFPSLYIIKYDERDYVYGLELFKDKNMLDLEVLPERVASSQNSDAHLADTLIGKTVDHTFEVKDGSLKTWRGIVLARAPIMNTLFYITYEMDHSLYTYQLLDDYKEGNLHIVPTSTKKEPEPFMRSLEGMKVTLSSEGGLKTGVIIYEVEAVPSLYFIMFNGDNLIHAYDLDINVKTFYSTMDDNQQRLGKQLSGLSLD